MPAGLLAPPLCWGCRAPARRGEALCQACRRALRRLGRDPVRIAGIDVWAPLAYEGPARELVRALKYRGADRLAGEMAAQIAAGGAHVAAPCPGAFLAGALVPVPLHPARRRRRGFNQAALIARELSRRTGLPVDDCLVLPRPRAPQAGRPRAERLGAQPGLRVRAGAQPPPRAVLVDDVVTTGATIAACAGALRAAGASEIRVLAYARTLAR
ncbi:MAG TPA: hypothetical protein VHG69_04880 [Thermoleophilaceae bacterium]|nr:hypothetical protein [Thermoleophilaceae bacterium]